MQRVLRANSVGREPARVSLEARLALTEALIAAHDVVACAQVGLDWLATHLAFDRLLCAVAEEGERPRLVAVAGLGIDPSQLNSFSIELEDTDHPLVRLL